MKPLVLVCALLLTVSSVFAQDPKEEPKAEARPVVEMKPRFTIFATGNGTFLLDTFTGDSWVQINTVWVTSPKTTLPPEIYKALLEAAFRVVTPNVAPAKDATPNK